MGTMLCMRVWVGGGGVTGPGSLERGVVQGCSDVVLK